MIPKIQNFLGCFSESLKEKFSKIMNTGLKTNTLWVDEFRPNNLEDLIMESKTKNLGINNII